MASRIEALSDGVFAIAITLLVLNVHLPSEAGPVAPQIPHVLPSIAAYVLSFAIVGMYWVAHHTMLGNMQNPGRAVWWPNLLVLLTVAFIPFPAGELGLHPLDAAALQLYGASLCTVNAAGALFWFTGARAGALVHAPQRFIRGAMAIHLSPIVVYVLGMIFASILPLLTLGLYVLVPLFFIVSAPWLPRILGASAPRAPYSSQSPD
jgi:uncharacterized membrane protein